MEKMPMINVVTLRTSDNSIALTAYMYMYIYITSHNIIGIGLPS